MSIGPIKRMTPADLGLDPRRAGLQDGRQPNGGMNVALSQIARSFRTPGDTSAAGDFEPAIHMLGYSSSSVNGAMTPAASFTLLEGPNPVTVDGTEVSSAGSWIVIANLTGASTDGDRVRIAIDGTVTAGVQSAISENGSMYASITALWLADSAPLEAQAFSTTEANVASVSGTVFLLHYTRAALTFPGG